MCVCMGVVMCAIKYMAFRFVQLGVCLLKIYVYCGTSCNPTYFVKDARTHTHARTFLKRFFSMGIMGNK